LSAAIRLFYGPGWIYCAFSDFVPKISREVSSDVLSASCLQRACCKLAHRTFGKLMRQIERIHHGTKRRNDNLEEGFGKYDM
jgi:hypothetical protein